ncbi:MAG: PmoA family protein [Pirellulales bacterium]
MKRENQFGLSFIALLATALASHAADVTVERTERGAVVKIDGEVFTEYLTKAGQSPALWPIIGPSGKKMTRTYPLGPKDDGGTTDHPHHQSLWFTHDEVSSPDVPRADFWKSNHNGDQGDQGPHIAHREFVKAESDGEVATIIARDDWMNGSKRLCEDERTLRFGQRSNGDRWIDFAITIKASDGDVTFGDTKEGTFAVRVADTMRVAAKQGGRIVNSQGLEDKAAWGVPAAWVDYTGPVEGETVGIAVFSHPQSFRPTPRWHVRDYGLLAANPFGQKEFPHPELADQGVFTIKKGDELTFHYRVLLHHGATEEADIANAYSEFASSP